MKKSSRLNISVAFAAILVLGACTTPSKQQSMQDAKRTLDEEKAKDDPCYEYRLSPEYDRCRAEQYRIEQRRAAQQKQRELLKESRESIDAPLKRGTRDLGL